MSDIVIKVEELSKQYRLGKIGTGSLAHDINRWWHRARGKEDPYLKVGDINDRTSKGNSNYVWSLRDINFEIKRGEAIGVIGRNGAGKSTLLKILSRTTTPTIGSVKIKGRVASLLEVGTGFHPELTGRENIFLNGAILGMTKNEIKKKFDEIVDFAGVERYVDTPVKRYSSGMYVRLAFGVAAHLEPEILVVDEVLAVGDAEFQKKALGKMQDVSKGEGRTVLFVSHNMGAVKSFCTRGLFLKNGEMVFEGGIDDAIENYLLSNSETADQRIELATNRKGNGKVIFADFFLETPTGVPIQTAMSGEDIVLVFQLKVTEAVDKVDLGFSFHGMYGEPLSNLYSSYQQKLFNFNEGYHIVKCRVNNFSFGAGSIIVRGRITESGNDADWPVDNLGTIKTEMGDFYGTGSIGSANWNSKFLIRGIWQDL